MNNDIKYNSKVFAKCFTREISDDEGNTKYELVYAAPSGKQIIQEFDTEEAMQAAYEKAEIGGISSKTLEDYVKKVELIANYYNKEDVNQMIGAIETIKLRKVQELPQQGEAGVMYLVPAQDSKTGDVFDEYLWVENKFEKIGSTRISLDGYATETFVTNAIAAITIPSALADLTDDANHRLVTDTEKATWSGKQDALTEGSNISIENGTISATDTTYDDATTSTSGLMSATDKTKLDNIASGAEVNVQANWNETDTSSDSYIQNKPIIPIEQCLVRVFPDNFPEIQTSDINGSPLSSNNNNALKDALNEAYSSKKCLVMTGMITGKLSIMFVCTKPMLNVQHTDIDLFSTAIVFSSNHNRPRDELTTSTMMQIYVQAVWTNDEIIGFSDTRTYCHRCKFLPLNNTESYTPSGNYNPATKKYVDDSISAIASQVSTMPTADANNLGKIYQFVGATDTYTNGYFYKCVSDGEQEPTYSWEQINVQDGGSTIVNVIESNSSENPFIFEDNEPGIYMLGKDIQFYKFGADNYRGYQFYYKINSNDTIKTAYLGGRIIDYKVKPSTVGNTTEFALFDNPSISSDGQISYALLAKNSIYLRPLSGSTKPITGSFVGTGGEQTITAKKTFTVLPESSVVPTTDNQLVNKKYVDDNAGASYTAGTNINIDANDAINCTIPYTNNNNVSNVALGAGATASNSDTVVLGWNARAYRSYGVAVGVSARSRDWGIAIGRYAENKAAIGIAIGHGAETTLGGMAFGYNAKNTKNNQVMFGSNDSIYNGYINEIVMYTSNGVKVMATEDYADSKASQVSTMPTASADYLDKIVQFTGTTDSTYTNGYFYKCVSDGQDPATYSWEEVEVQPSSGGTSYTAGTNISIDSNNAINCSIPYEEDATFEKFRVGKNSAFGNQSFAIGLGCKAEGMYRGAIGVNAKSNHIGSIAIGYRTETTKNNQLKLGVNVITLGNDKDVATEDYVTQRAYELAGLTAYDSTAIYAIDDYVYYNNLIYKCNTAISVAEDWTAAHWTQKTYLEYMRDILFQDGDNVAF